MGTREIDFSHVGRAGTDWNQRWQEWLRQYGIRPDEVPASSSLVADDDAYTITYEAMPRGEDGKRISTGDPDPDASPFLRVTRVLQLEAPALPFPVVQ